MQEIIYQLDNWTIIKLLGGTAVVLTATLVFFSKYLLTKFSQRTQHTYDKRLEEIKGAITKGNNTLNTAIEGYVSSSQKILEKKIQAYDTLWSCIVNLRNRFPAGICLVYQLFLDSWFEKDTAFKDLDNNPKLGPILQLYDTDEEMKAFVDNGTLLAPHKPYLSDQTYKLYYTYQGMIGNITHQFIVNYSKSRVFNWKKDKGLESILKITLTEKEIEYIKSLMIGSLNALMDLLEYKILQDLRDTLGIKQSPADTISYLKDIEQILETSKNKD